MSSFSGIDLSALQALMAQQAMNAGDRYRQMRRENPAASSQEQARASGYSALREQYGKDFRRLREEAQRASKQLIGAQGGYQEQSKYLGGTMTSKPVGAAFGGYDPRFAQDLGILAGNAWNPASKRSQYYQDMIPYLDRYNQLRRQYEDMGMRF